jgi:hypothetical protein
MEQGRLSRACSVWSARLGDAAEGDFEAEGSELADVVGDLAADVGLAAVVACPEVLSAALRAVRPGVAASPPARSAIPSRCPHSGESPSPDAAASCTPRRPESPSAADTRPRRTATPARHAPQGPAGPVLPARYRRYPSHLSSQVRPLCLVFLPSGKVAKPPGQVTRAPCGRARPARSHRSGRHPGCRSRSNQA